MLRTNRPCDNITSTSCRLNFHSLRDAVSRLFPNLELAFNSRFCETIFFFPHVKLIASLVERQKRQVGGCVRFGLVFLLVSSVLLLFVGTHTLWV